MNVVVNLKVKAVLWECINDLQQNVPVHFHNDVLCPMAIKDKNQQIEIVSNLKNSLTYHLASRDAVNYWKEKEKILVSSTHQEIEVQKYANRNAAPNLQQWLVKQHSSFCRVGRMLF